MNGPQRETIPVGESQGFGLRLNGVVIAIALAASFLAFVPFYPDFPTLGLDASWKLALNEAVVRHLVFGKDVIFTFGPLGFVVTRTYDPGIYGLMIGFAGFLFAALFMGFVSLARGRGVYALLLLPFVMIQPIDAAYLVMPLILLLLVTQWCSGRQRDDAVGADESGWGVILILAAAVALLPLIKGSYTGAALPCSALSLFLLARHSRGRAGFLAGWMILILVSAWWAVGQPLLALPGFFAAQAQIISGYGDAMSLTGPASQILVYLAAAAVVGGLFGAGLLARFGRIGLAPAAGLVAVIFIGLNAAFVRHDLHAVHGGRLLVVIALLALLMLPDRRRLLGLAAGVAAATFIFHPYGYMTPKFMVLEDAYYMFRSVEGLLIDLARPSQFERTYERALQDIRREQPLPASAASVDIYPTETSLIFANGWKWSPRPVLQSYSAYTPALIQRDRAHLVGPSAPERILIAVELIDGRYPALEDGFSWPALLSRYRPAGRMGPFLILDRRPAPRDVRPGRPLLASETEAIGQPVAIPTTPSPVWATIEVTPTLLGRLDGLLFKRPALSMNLEYENGTSKTFRFMPASGRVGFVLTPTVTDAQGLQALSVGAGREYWAGRTPVSITLSGDRGTGLFWRRQYAIKLSELSIPADAGALHMLFDAQAPVPTLAAAGGDCSIDLINGAPASPGHTPARASVLKVDGWAAAAAKDGRLSDKIWLIVTGQDGKAIMAQTRLLERPDVASYYHQPRLDQAGFTALVDAQSLHGRLTVQIVQQIAGRFQPCRTPVSLAP